MQRRVPWWKLPRAIFIVLHNVNIMSFIMSTKDIFIMSLLACCSFQSVEKKANWLHPPAHQGSNMPDLPVGTGERGRQHAQGSVLSFPLIACQRTDVQGPVIMEKKVVPVSYSLTPQTRPALPLARLKTMADRWTLPLTHGLFPAHAHCRGETCSTAAQPIHSR